MFIWLHERLNDEEGFTLIELMVVVLIIAILIAIAIPTFLGARRRAQDRQAQSNLRNGLTAEKTYYADAQIYTDQTNDLRPIESNLSWGTVEARSRGVVVEDTGADTAGASGFKQGVVLKSLSASGTLFCIMDTAQDFSYNGVTTAGTYYHKVDNATSASTCPTSGWGTTTSAW